MAATAEDRGAARLMIAPNSRGLGCAPINRHRLRHPLAASSAPRRSLLHLLAKFATDPNLRGKSNKSPDSTVYGTKLDHQYESIANEMEGGHVPHGVYVRVT
jgi:hypothetical protein